MISTRTRFEVIAVRRSGTIPNLVEKINPGGLISSPNHMPEFLSWDRDCLRLVYFATRMNEFLQTRFKGTKIGVVMQGG